MTKYFPIKRVFPYIKKFTFIIIYHSIKREKGMPLGIFKLYYIHYKTSRITSSCPVKITGYRTLKGLATYFIIFKKT